MQPAFERITRQWQMFDESLIAPIIEPLSNRSGQHHNHTEVDFPAKKPHRWRSATSSAFTTAKTETGTIFLPELLAAGTPGLARIHRIVQHRTAVWAAMSLNFFGDALIQIV
ncbi:hypothetical protein AB833_14850 [Chromatiales bacterium (ex Bugula neritina AB1)]|nr:hypothetical protein AB833_14850 [Chromatiales bacterium (ex Bugula neritina AB1)]